MPQSLNIAAFVFGAVLVLLALVVGKFKLFGAEVEGTVSKASRVIAFLFGIFLIARGLNLGADPPAAQPASVSPQAAVQPASVSPQAAAVQPQAGSQRAALNEGKESDANPQTASRERSMSAPAPRRVSAAKDLEDFLPGVWRARTADPSTGIISENVLRFWSNGTYSGTESALVNGNPVTMRRAGTWSARPVSSDSFVLTVNDAGTGIARSYTFRVIDRNSVENEDQNYIAHRLSQ
jgi:hypothetical protein